MEIKSVKSVYFGKSGATKRIATAAASVISENVSSADLSRRTDKAPSFSEESVLIAALPACGGRLSSAAADSLRALSGNGAPAVAIVVFSDESFGDSLLELTDLLSERGFSVIGAAAFVERGSARPDDGDFSRLVEFSSACARALESFDGCCCNLGIPGSRPYGGAQRKKAARLGIFGHIFGARAPEQTRLEPEWFV